MRILSVIPGKIYSGRLVVDFFSIEDIETIKLLIEKIDRDVGRIMRQSKLNNMVFEAIGKKKYLPFIIKSLRSVYEFQNIELRDVINKPAILEKFGSIWELRKHFYRWVQENFLGYVPLGAREQVLRSYARSLTLNLETVERIIDPSLQKMMKLKKKISIDPIDFVGLINYNILLKVFAFAKEIKVSMTSEKLGGLVKEVIYRSKKMGIYSEVKVVNHTIRIYIEGPVEITAPSLPTNFGSRVAYVILPALSESREWELISVLDDDGKDVLFKLRSSSAWAPKITFPWEINKADIPKPAFDSLLEKKIYVGLKKVFENLSRESDVLILSDGSIFIPDFTAKIGEDKKIHIEVVGFWTESYLQKKMEKLNKLWKAGLRNIILLVDEKLIDKFRSEHPIVYIKKDGTFSERELQKKMDLIIG
ncbi:MAG: DUF790 family protein [Candidatus Njordarchaeia archaeon]